jgi:hypothetical protein
MNNTDEKKLFVTVIGTVALASFGAAMAVGTNYETINLRDRIEILEQHPTYHCDGSKTLGYAEPGSPEASACWIEEKK